MSNKLEGADKEWGFCFGVKGTMSIEETRLFLGVSERTVYRLIEDDSIRGGYIRGKRVVCRESVARYLSTVEA